MSDSFISFATRDIDAAQLNDVLSRYLTYERLRIFRRHLVLRLGGLLLVGSLASLEWHLVPEIAVIGTGVAVVAMIITAVLAERRARRIFTTLLCRSQVFKEQAPKTQ